MQKKCRNTYELIDKFVLATDFMKKVFLEQTLTCEELEIRNTFANKIKAACMHVYLKINVGISETVGRRKGIGTIAVISLRKMNLKWISTTNMR